MDIEGSHDEMERRNTSKFPSAIDSGKTLPKSETVCKEGETAGLL